MSETLSVSQRTIERDLSALQKKGVLKREGKDNNGVWISAGSYWSPLIGLFTQGVSAKGLHLSFRFCFPFPNGR
jgi:hypothetical protein